MKELFFELIQVAIGTRYSLSRIPTEAEWEELFDMADKQSLIGICFAGLQRLGANVDDGFEKIGMSEDLYFDWIGTVATIQARNKKMNKRCVELQERLAKEGLRSCILKGQGVAQLYGKRLASLRQSGDIDVWVDAPKKNVVDWAKNIGLTETAGYLHVGCHIFDETEVELHYRPTYCRCLWHNKRMQEFCNDHKKDWSERDGIIVPSWGFNAIYILSHIYRHLFGLGIGMRQLMDYYFVLCAAPTKIEKSDLQKTLKHLGLYDFAGAVMFVMREVFHMEEQYMICPVDERRGYALLRDVIQMGNFGKQDKEQKIARKTKIGGLQWKLKRETELIKFYPVETLCEPIWKLIRIINK